ncbi:MAG TPA: DUF3127 domain-containing protein [Tenuifilaceae bacterium]|nr:DUF3127 domain-containing protein [Tenuifilaceae bacterium]
MEIIGKLFSKLPQQSGEGKNGKWVKQEFIVETQDQFPRKICIALWGDKVRDLDLFQMGESLKAMVNVESREFNGKWYTDVKAWRLEKVDKSSTSPTPEPYPMPGPDDVPPFIPGEFTADEGDDLPF